MELVAGHVYAWYRHLHRQCTLEKARRGREIEPQTRARWLADYGTRATTALTAEGIITDEEVARMTDGELLRLPNLGRVTLKAIRAHIPIPPRFCPHCGRPC